MPNIVQQRIKDRERAARHRAKNRDENRPAARTVDAAIAEATKHTLAEVLAGDSRFDAALKSYLDRVGFVALTILLRRGFDQEATSKAVKRRFKPKFMPSAP